MDGTTAPVVSAAAIGVVAVAGGLLVAGKRKAASEDIYKDSKKQKKEKKPAGTPMEELERRNSTRSKRIMTIQRNAQGRSFHRFSFTGRDRNLPKEQLNYV